MADSLRLRARISLFAVVAILLAAAPPLARAHSELESSEPADGAVLETSPSEIVLTFSEPLDPTRSSISLRDATGAELAEAHVATDDNTVMRLTPPTLQPGAYEIRWTSVAEDGDVLRGRVHFEINAAATSSPSPEDTPSIVPSAPAVASPTPSANPSPTASSTDVVFPIVAAIVVVALLGAWLLRNRARTSRP